MITFEDMALQMIELQGCDTPIKLMALRRSMREFCQLTEAWRETLPAIDVVADQSEYAISPSHDAVILRVMSLKIDDFEKNSTDYEFDGEALITLNDSITPSGAITDGLVIDVALMPTFTAHETDEVFTDRWGDAILCGAMARLQRMTNRPWTDISESKRNAGMFETYKAMARREALAKNRVVTTRTTPRPWKT